MTPARSSRPHTRLWRRWAATASAVGAGATMLVIWFEEMIILVAEFIGLIFLPILAGFIYLFNHLVFNSVMPKKMDRQNSKDKRSRL